MKLLYIGTGDLQQRIMETLNKTRDEYEVLVASTKEELVATLEGGKVDILLFDYACPANVSLQQTRLYARAFKAPVVALKTAVDDVSDHEVPEERYVFREHIGQLPFVITGIKERSLLEKENQELEQKLERNSRYYQTLLKHIDDFVFLFGETGDLVYLSPSAQQLTGFSDLEDRQLFEYIHPDDRKTFFYLFKKVLKKPGARVEVRTRILHKGTHYIWIDGSVTNLSKDDAISAFVLSCRDVTERKVAEDSMMRINRLYDSIRQINRAILSIEDEKTLFKEVCCVATEYGNFKMAYISVMDPTTGKLKLVQSSGVAEEDVEPSMVVSELEHEPFECALREAMPYVCNDIQSELDAPYWNYVAVQKGFRSFVVLPLCRQGRVIGVFVLAAASTDAFTPKEIELLEETIDDISFKLDILKKEKMRTAGGITTPYHQFKSAGSRGWA